MKPHQIHSSIGMALVAAIAAVAGANSGAAQATVTPITGAAFSFGAGPGVGFSGTGALGETEVPLAIGNGSFTNVSETLADGVTLVINSPEFNGTSPSNPAIVSATNGTIYENYVFGSESPNTLTFTGLTAGASYEVAAYAESADTFTLGSTSVTASGAYSGGGTYTPYTLGVNYATLMGTADSSGDLTISVAPGTGHTNFRMAGVGIASVTTPEPASAATLLGGAAVLLLLARRKRVFS